MVSASKPTLQPYYSPSQPMMQALHFLYLLYSLAISIKKQAEIKLSLFPSS